MKKLIDAFKMYVKDILKEVDYELFEDYEEDIAYICINIKGIDIPMEDKFDLEDKLCDNILDRLDPYDKYKIIINIV